MKNLHILIAEDDIDDGEIIVDCFRDHHDFSKVTWVKNGRELLDFLRTTQEKVNVILTDINMPLISGIEALEEIFKDASLCDIPVFIYSSSINPIYERKCKELGGMGFLIKPYNLLELQNIPIQIVDILEEKKL